MLIGGNVKPSDLKVGNWLYFDEEISATLSIQFNHSSIKEDFEPGFYRITSISKPLKHRQSVSLRRERSALTFPVVFDDNASVIIAETIRVDEGVMIAMTDVKKLIAENSSRHTCASCGKPLNIVGVNVRICNPCEDSFSNLPEDSQDLSQLIPLEADIDEDLLQYLDTHTATL